MKRIATFAVMASLITPLGAHANQTPATAVGDTALQVTRAGSQPSARGPAEYFTGTVRVDPLFPADAPSRMSGANVTFEPGARSAWHSHPVGQVLIVTAGLGWVQREGSPPQEIRPGDVVRIAPGVKHWHGAAKATGMTHIALQEHVDGQVATWMEHVSNDQYPR